MSTCVHFLSPRRSDATYHNRASLPGLVPKPIQKFTPSLHKARGNVLGPVGVAPRGDKSVAFQIDTFGSLPLSTTSIRSPSKAACSGPLKKLPLSVAITVPASQPTARTTVTVFYKEFGTQMFVPSNAGYLGALVTSTDCRIAPVESSLYGLSFVPETSSVTQMLLPS